MSKGDFVGLAVGETEGDFVIPKFDSQLLPAGAGVEFGLKGFSPTAVGEGAWSAPLEPHIMFDQQEYSSPNKIAHILFPSAPAPGQGSAVWQLLWASARLNPQ